ncbi:uncharacterized protein LOC116252717 [Nymphaea colorata]|nr:uncharacterized protein LOC116252717 [Nymphaea colorata]
MAAAMTGSSLRSHQLWSLPSSRAKPTIRTSRVPRRITPRMSSSGDSSIDPLTALTRILFGRSLPPSILVGAVRSTWTSAWQVMMSQMAPSDRSGSYSRPDSPFRRRPGATQTVPDATGRFHLYVGLPCPWAHRTLIVRALKGLERAVPVSIASPSADGSWEFRETDTQRGDYSPGADKANGCRTLRQVYKLRAGGYDGRSTVPMLWDSERRNVFCNESLDIAEFFNSGMNDVAGSPSLDLSPAELREEVDRWIEIIYPNVNNGVYRCGFAQSQEAYDSAADGLFTTLDMLESHLAESRYLCGDRVTLADIFLFTTLIRFDLVYNVLFRCTKKKLVQYPNLHGYMRDIYQIPKVAETCDFNAIMDGYYKILFPLNPGGIRPAIPSGFERDSLFRPHNREVLSGRKRGTGAQ